MFSVIIPLYNKAPYIEKSIQSVLTQSYQEFELIVIDDGSKDDSLKIVQKFKSSKVQIIEQTNSGVSTARNNGVKVAKYDYIAFLDADDWWEPNFLEEMNCLIKNYPDAGIYGSGYYLVKNGRRRIAPIGVTEDFEEGGIDYCQVYAETLCMPLWTGAVVMPRNVFYEMQGFKPQLKLGEDFDLWIRVALKYPVVLLNKPLSNYNQDVDLKNRAIGKLHDPKTHILYNLDYLEELCVNNLDLKCLLDKLRVYSLYPYYLNNLTRSDAKKEFEKVDWKKQSKSIRRKYRTPIVILKIANFLQKIASRIKQKIKK